MIAKRVTRANASSFSRLTTYIVSDKSEQDPAAWSRMADYILDTKGLGERVGAVRITNCESDTVAWAVKEIQHTQALNGSSRADRTYHLVVSFPPGERPNDDQVRDIEDELCAAIGLGSHQRISAVHQDTEHFHMHIAINKVHPQIRRNVSPAFDMPRLMDACDRLEMKHGLIRTNHGRRSDRGARGRARDMDAHSGMQSFLGAIRETAAADLVAAREQAGSWQEFHEAAAQHGLEIRPRGAGLVFGRAGGRGPQIKASDVDRSLAFRPMTERFGEYVPPAGRAADQQQVQAQGLQAHPNPPADGAEGGAYQAGTGRAYKKTPGQTRPDASGLFAEYQTVRQAAAEGRAAAIGVLRTQRDKYLADLRAYHGRQREILKERRAVRGYERKLEYRKLANERAADLAADSERAARDRMTARANHPIPTWQDFLVKKAEDGDTAALGVLRSLDRRRERIATALLQAGTAEQGRHILRDGLKRTVRRDGSVSYVVTDGGRVRDDVRHVSVEHVTAGAATLAVLLAADRFGETPLAVRGADDFRREVVQAAGLRGLNIRFADGAMEAARRAKQAEMRSAEAPTHEEALNAFLTARNIFKGTVSEFSEHRRWQPEDAGAANYRGRRHLIDRSEVVLLERNGVVLVKPVTSAQAAKASTLTIGQTVQVDDRGRLIEARGHKR